MYRQALAQFEQAREIADVLDAGELAKLTRENIVEIHESQGDTLASVEVLREIQGQLSQVAPETNWH